MASDNIDVTVLLRQLEELKQKKAQNIKKLKRKLGRAVVLKQPCTEDESSRSDSNDNDKSFSRNKNEVSQVRKVFGELNCKDQLLNSLQSPGNETKNFKDSALCAEKNIINPELSSDCSKRLPTELHCSPVKNSELVYKKFAGESNRDDQTENLSNCQKDISGNSEHNKLIGCKRSTEFQNDEEIGSNTSYKKCSIGDSEHDQFVGRKRSSTEFLSDQAISPFKNNKKTKLTNNKFFETSKEQLVDLEAECKFSVKSVPPASVDCDKDNCIDNKSCRTPVQLNKTEVTNLVLPLTSEDLSFDQKKNFENLKDNTHVNQNFENNLSPTVPRRAGSTQNLIVKKSVEEENAKITSSTSENEVRKISNENNEGENEFSCNFYPLSTRCNSNVVKAGTGKINFSQKLLVENYPDEDVTLSKNSASRTEIRKISIENDEGDNDSNSCNDVHSPTHCDLNVIEVPDTELVIDHQSQDNNFDCNKKCDVLTTTDDTISEQKVKHSACEDLNAGSTLNEIAETEDIAYKYFPTDVASFEEVITEAPPPVELDGYLSEKVKDRHPSINCSFTDEEDETAELENNVDLDKLFKEESDIDESEAEEENLSQSSTNDCDDSSSPLVQKHSNCLDSGVNDVAKIATCHANDIVIESEVLMIPETELFDFASYSNHEVDDIAQNVCIETNYANNCDEEMAVDDTCIGTENDINTHEEPVVFLAEVDDSCHDVCIGVENNINCNDNCDEEMAVDDTCIGTENDINTHEEPVVFLAKVDDSCHDVCIGVENSINSNDNCDEEMTVDDTCIGTENDINTPEEPVVFLAKVEDSCHDVCIGIENSINCNEESVCGVTLVEDGNKNIIPEIDCNKESDCNNSEVNLNDCCSEIENANSCKKKFESKGETMSANDCNSKQNLEEIKDCAQFSSQNNSETDSFGTEDFLKLIDLQQMPFSSDSSKSNSNSENKDEGDLESSLKFQCCFQSDITEEVTQLQLCYFNNSYYLFIQHHTWIQVWRQETRCDWMKIFAHQVDDFQLKEMCLSQSESYLVLVMLLSSKQNQQCLQFLVFERESRLIKLMEHTHWFENSEREDVFLCGLDDLKFASAQGKDDAFKVYSHSFSCLESNPRLLTITLGSAADCLHSLCRIDKLPNALLGVSKTMLYVWHLLEARLVTSVRLQTEDSIAIENCVWTTVENGLVFLMTTHREKESAKACQLLAANLATGFCEDVLTYSLQPAKEVSSLSNRKMNLVYSEPFLAATSEKGAFIWSVDDEYCCASLMSPDYSSIAILPTQDNTFLVVVGCSGGCVNCYEITYSTF